MSRCSPPHTETARRWGPAETRPRTWIQTGILFPTAVTCLAVFLGMCVSCWESIPASLACWSLRKGESPDPVPLLLRFTTEVLLGDRQKLHLLCQLGPDIKLRGGGQGVPRSAQMVQSSLEITRAELDWSRHLQSHWVSLGNPCSSVTRPWRHVDVADKIVRIIGFLSAFFVELSCRVGQAAHFHHCVLMFLQFGPQGWEEGPISPVWSLCHHVIGWMLFKMRSRLVIQPCFSQLRMIFPHGPNCSYFLIVDIFRFGGELLDSSTSLCLWSGSSLYLSGRSLFTV